MTKIKFIRLERQLKAKQLAFKAGITPSYLCLIERGRIPSSKVKAQLAKAIGRPIKELWSVL